MNANGNEWFRVCVDGTAKTVYYTRDPRVVDTGHLKFTDHEGRIHVLSASHRWSVDEAENVPNEIERACGACE